MSTRARKQKKQVRMFVGAIAALLVFSAAGYWYFHLYVPSVNASLHEGFSRETLACGTKAVLDKARCLDSLFENYLSEYSPEEILRVFGAALKEDAAVRQDCHQIAHGIGRSTMARTGNLVEIFRLDRALDVCAGGFYHGAIEKIFRPDEDVPAGVHISLSEFTSKIPALCGRFEKVDRESECIHGIGHGAMYITGSIKESLAACDLLAQSKRRPCFTGVFMENFIEGNMKNKDDMFYPCSTMKGDYRLECYFVSSYHLVELGLSGMDLINACHAAPDDRVGSPESPRELCVRGYGVFFLAHDAIAGEMERVRAFCEELSGEEDRYCVESVSGRMVNLSEDGRDAFPFCQMLEEQSLRSRCFFFSKKLMTDRYGLSEKKVEAECRDRLPDPAWCLDPFRTP